MAGDIRIGFSMHPRWADAGGLENFISPLRQVGLSALEFELDDHLEGWSAFGTLMEITHEMGLGLSFHGPYRLPRSLVGFSGEARERIQADIRPLLAIAETWARKSMKCHTLVVHAAVAREPASRGFLEADTLAFLAWVLEEFPDLQVALENNHPPAPGEVKVGVEPEEVLALIASINSPRLGACWDMGHDFLRHRGEEPAPEWLANVVHVHVHDVDENGEDHFPLIFGRVPYEHWLGAWKVLSGRGNVVLELKGKHLQDWSRERITEVLKANISFLHEALA